MKSILLVDGYHVLGAWPQLTRGRTLNEARDELIHRLSDYAGFTGQRVILVFDAWQSDATFSSVEHSAALEIVYTASGETADHYIERASAELAEKVAQERVKLRVASSDGVEQTVVLGRGALRISSRELIIEMRQAKTDEKRLIDARPIKQHPLMGRLPSDDQEKLEQMRRGKI